MSRRHIFFRFGDERLDRDELALDLAVLVNELIALVTPAMS